MEKKKRERKIKANQKRYKNGWNKNRNRTKKVKEETVKKDSKKENHPEIINKYIEKDDKLKEVVNNEIKLITINILFSIKMINVKIKYIMKIMK